MSSSDAPVFGDVGEGEMFRHVQVGRRVGGVLRRELHVVDDGGDVGNAVVVATGERWVFHGGAGVVRFAVRSPAHGVLASLPEGEWPRHRGQDCESCGLRERCGTLVRATEMTVCEAVVEMVVEAGQPVREVRRRRRRSGYHRMVDRR